ncbi:MAG: hypothetical protein EU539_09955 [Promethearchaeota archaeon]|nr:MAG: hypothetical protein EU539_09955 [Candidatus Lokiarchaeota archaeon]
MLNEIERDFILIHILFAVICVVILTLLISLSIGIKLFILVIIYNSIIPLFGAWRKHEEWINIWLFSFILSIFQIWPDWFLSAELNILVFPDDGLFKIGTVSGYMLFLWAIPFFIIIFTGKQIQERYSKQKSYWFVGLISFLIFGISEMTIWMIGSWYAQNVHMIGNAAIYILIPEIILGLSTFHGYEKIKGKQMWCKILIAFVIMLLYLGSAGFFYFLIERVLYM